MTSEPRDNLTPGAVIADRFRLLRTLGEGGMGVALLATELSTERRVVIKCLRPGHEDAPQRRARFVREAQLLARIQHPNVVTIHDTGVLASGAPFIAMEFIEGKTLGELMLGGGLSAARIFLIIDQVLSALVEVHASGVVHRDLKPDNVMVTRTADGRERVKVLDFGIARLLGQEGSTLTQDGMVIGTPRYMSPEQVDNRPVDGRSDLYTVGVMLYELLTGRHPLNAETPVQFLVAHLHQDADPPSQHSPDRALTPEIDALVLRALSRDPSTRFESAWAMQRALAPLLPVFDLAPTRTLETPESMQMRLHLSQEIARALMPPPTDVTPIVATITARAQEVTAPRRPGAAYIAVISSLSTLAVALLMWWALSDAPSPPPLRTSAPPTDAADVEGASLESALTNAPSPDALDTRAMTQHERAEVSDTGKTVGPEPSDTDASSSLAQADTALDAGDAPQAPLPWPAGRDRALAQRLLEWGRELPIKVPNTAGVTPTLSLEQLVESATRVTDDVMADGELITINLFSVRQDGRFVQSPDRAQAMVTFRSRACAERVRREGVSDFCELVVSFWPNGMLARIMEMDMYTRHRPAPQVQCTIKQLWALGERKGILTFLPAHFIYSSLETPSNPPSITAGWEMIIHDQFRSLPANCAEALLENETANLPKPKELLGMFPYLGHAPVTARLPLDTSVMRPRDIFAWATGIARAGSRDDMVALKNMTLVDCIMLASEDPPLTCQTSTFGFVEPSGKGQSVSVSGSHLHIEPSGEGHQFLTPTTPACEVEALVREAIARHPEIEGERWTIVYNLIDDPSVAPWRLTPVEAARGVIDMRCPTKNNVSGRARMCSRSSIAGQTRLHPLVLIVVSDDENISMDRRDDGCAEYFYRVTCAAARKKKLPVGSL